VVSVTVFPEYQTNGEDVVWPDEPRA